MEVIWKEAVVLLHICMSHSIV